MPRLAANQLDRITYKKQVNHPEINSDFFSAYYKKGKTFKPTISKLNDILYFNTMRFGLQELLRYADRNSMAHSAEVRLPFLSHELVQFVFNLPAELKIKKGFTKYLLRSAMMEFLPGSIVWRKEKVGFEPPQRDWMNNKRVQELIVESRKKLVKQGILKVDVSQLPVRTLGAHDDGNFDWRYLCAANCL
jgi:asparagine synthase (glutamine-hydrolysing)